MGLSDLSFSATNINTGNYADRPAQCKPGDIYICTDAPSLECKTDNTWSTITPKNVGVVINMNIEASDNIRHQIIEERTGIVVSSWSDFGEWIVSCDVDIVGTVKAGMYMRHENGDYCHCRLLHNDVEVGSVAIRGDSANIYDLKSFTTSSMTIKNGDTLKIQYMFSSAATYNDAKNPQISYDVLASTIGTDTGFEITLV
jgi:hypothetical protein